MNHRFIDYSEGSDIFGNEAIILRTNRDSIPFWNMLVVKGNDEHDYSGDVNALNFYISLFKNHYCSFVPDENLGAASYHILDGNINFNGFNNASFKLTLIGRPAEYELPIDSFTNEVVHLNGCWNFPVSLNECQDCEL